MTSAGQGTAGPAHCPVDTVITSSPSSIVRSLSSLSCRCHGPAPAPRHYIICPIHHRVCQNHVLLMAHRRRCVLGCWQLLVSERDTSTSRGCLRAPSNQPNTQFVTSITCVASEIAKFRVVMRLTPGSGNAFSYPHQFTNVLQHLSHEKNGDPSIGEK